MNNTLKKTVAIVTAITCAVWMMGPGVVQALTAEELQTQIDELLATIATLQTQIAELEGEAVVTIEGVPADFTFETNLKLTSTGDDVKYLQIVLNSDAETQLAESGVGSAGNETSYFGPLTKGGVIKFQEKYTEDCLASWGLTEGTGFVGSTTRAKLNSLLAAAEEEEEEVCSEITEAVECVTAGCSWDAATETCSAVGEEEEEEEEEEEVVCSEITDAVECVTEGCSWDADTETCSAGEEEEVEEGTVEVSLADDTPATQTLARSSTGIAIVKFNFISGSDTTLNSIKLTRSGVGLATDYANVFLYDGVTRLKSGRSISSETNTVEFINLSVALEAGTTKTITVKVDVWAGATPGDINIISIVSADDIGITDAVVSGTFPISANYMAIVTLAVGTSTIANGPSLAKPTLGQIGAKVARLKITAGADDIEVGGMTLTQAGSLSNSNLANFELKVGSEVVATTDSMVGETIILTLDTPYEISKSQSKIFTLYADLLGGRTIDTILFYLEEATDIQIIDKQYNLGSAITNNFTGALANCLGYTGTCTAGSLQGGVITLADNGPAANTVARNTTNVELLNFGFTSSRNVTVKDYDLVLTPVNKANGTITNPADPAKMTTGSESEALTSASHGLSIGDYVIISSDGNATYSTTIDIIAKVTTITDANIVKVTPVSGTDLDPAASPVWSTIMKISVVRLTDTDTGNVLYSNTTDRYYYSTSAATDTIASSDDFDVATGQTRHLSLRVDIHSWSASGMTLQGGVDFTTATTIKDYDANEYIVAADIVAGDITGKIMTIGATTLTVALASTPVSATKVKGTSDVDVLGVSLAAGSSGDVKITEIKVRLLGDDDGTFDGTGAVKAGDTAANTMVDTIALYEGSTKVAGPKSLALTGNIAGGGYYYATFDGLEYTISAGTSPKLIVRLNIKNTIAAARWLAATIVPASDITAEDTEGNSLTISNTANGGVNEDDAVAVMGDTTPPVVITITTAGTLSGAVEGSPDAAIVVAGDTGIVMAKYKFSAVNEAYTIEKLTVISDTGGPFGTADTTNDNNIVRVGVRYTNKAGTSETDWTSITTGLANFGSIDAYVPINDSTYIEVLADLNTIAAGATSGESPRLGINSSATSNVFRAVGEGSSETKAIANVTFTAESDVKAMVVRKTAPTVAKKSGLSTTLVNGLNTLYGVTIAADSADAISLRSLKFKLVYSSDAVADDLDTFTFYRGTANVTNDVRIVAMGDTSATPIADGYDLKSATADINAADDAYDGYVLVEFNNSAASKEIVSAGGENTYYLRVNASGVDNTADRVSCYIADDTADISASTLNYYAVARKTGTPIRYDASAGGAGSAENVLYVDVDNSGTITAGDYVLNAVVQKVSVNANLTDALTTYEANTNNVTVAGVVALGDIDTATDGTDELYILNGDAVLNATYAVSMDATDGDTDSVIDGVIRFDSSLTTGTVNVLYIDLDGDEMVSAGDYVINASVTKLDVDGNNTNAESTLAAANEVFVVGVVALAVTTDGTDKDLYVDNIDGTAGHRAILIEGAGSDAADADTDSAVDGAIAYDAAIGDATLVTYIDIDGSTSVTADDYIIGAYSTKLDDDADHTNAEDAVAVADSLFYSGLIVLEDTTDATDKDLYVGGVSSATAANRVILVEGAAGDAADADTGDTRIDMAGYNFIWSDNSATLHSINTLDWTNGYLVNDLSTYTQTLSY